MTGGQLSMRADRSRAPVPRESAADGGPFRFQTRLGIDIRLLPFHAPIFQFVERDSCAGNGTHDVVAIAQHAERAGEVMDTRGPAAAVHQHAPNPLPDRTGPAAEACRVCGASAQPPEAL